MSFDSAASDSSAEGGTRFSLITVTYNSVTALTEAWAKAGPVPADVEWIVVDNNSTDGSAEFAQQLGARVIRNPNNDGFSSANNLGLAEAKGAFVGFVNPDVQVDYSGLAYLAEVAQAQHALVAPQLMNSDGSRQPNGRGYPFLMHKVRNRLAGEKVVNNDYLLYAVGDSPRSVCWLMGAVVFGERSVVESIGGWDPYFFLYYEDKDISLRAWKAGIPVLLVPGAQWTHGWARETASVSIGAWRRELASMAKFYSRYPEFLIGRVAAKRRHPRIESALVSAKAVL